ncbi:MAG: hypothetical protein KF755_11470, partial [Burkholderiaceae bacterium]|nr:hypothetical protein [Burkholderiaceae bacterium]
ARAAFGQDPIFVAILRGRGMDYRFDPVAALLDRTGVAAAMNGRFAIVDRSSPPARWDEALASDPDWLLLADGDSIGAVLRAQALAETPRDAVGRDALPFAIVSLHATLGEALRGLDQAQAPIAVVCSGDAARPGEVCGVIERQQIEAAVGYRV